MRRGSLLIAFSNILGGLLADRYHSNMTENDCLQQAIILFDKSIQYVTKLAEEINVEPDNLN
jgi:hypothetical protein